MLLLTALYRGLLRRSAGGPAAAAAPAPDAAATVAPAAPAPDVTTAAAPDAAAAPAAPALAGAVFGQSETDHYKVLSELGQDRADALARHLEALFGLYDGFFRYDASTLKAKLNVREFSDKPGFDAYMKQIVGQSKDDYVYLHYPSPERSELLVFPKDEPDFSASLAHQGFVQFIKAFIPNPPLWIREGVAVSFESAKWDDKAGKLDFPENLAWLETVKSLKERSLLLPLDKLLAIGQDDARAQLDVFYPQSWAMISFLLNSKDKAYNRLLWDSVAALTKEGASRTTRRGSPDRDTWYGSDPPRRPSPTTWPTARPSPSSSRSACASTPTRPGPTPTTPSTPAQSMNSASYVPDYYLGLIAYAQNQFDVAESHYKQALALGCDPAITNYALGVNAYAQNRLDNAKGFLKLAKEACPTATARRSIPS